MTLSAKKKKLLTSSTSTSKENIHERLKQTTKHLCDSSIGGIKGRNIASSFPLLEIPQISGLDLHVLYCF